jgi:hypothetical protein
MTNDSTPFPLHQWFDLSRRICEDQMALDALKEGLEPSGPEWDATVRHLRKVVKEHNAKF